MCSRLKTCESLYINLIYEVRYNIKISLIMFIYYIKCTDYIVKIQDPQSSVMFGVKHDEHNEKT